MQFQGLVARMHPTIWKSINVIQQEQESTKIKISQNYPMEEIRADIELDFIIKTRWSINTRESLPEYNFCSSASQIGGSARFLLSPHVSTSPTYMQK